MSPEMLAKHKENLQYKDDTGPQSLENTGTTSLLYLLPLELLSLSLSLFLLVLFL